MGDQITFSVSLSDMMSFKELTDIALDNSRELLELHLKSFGEDTRKNKRIADMHRQEIELAEKLLSNFESHWNNLI